jgi:hypothetical protein
VTVAFPLFPWHVAEIVAEPAPIAVVSPGSVQIPGSLLTAAAAVLSEDQITGEQAITWPDWSLTEADS